MAVIFPNSASLSLRQGDPTASWYNQPGVTITGQQLSYDQMDSNWWALDSASIGLIDLTKGAAYTGSSNTFTEDQIFLNNVGKTSSLKV
jgi:hypothetical protein